MRTPIHWRWLVTIAGLTLLPWSAAAQPMNFEVPPANPQVPLPLYSTRPESGGFYTYFEFLFMHGTRPIDENQAIAYRGFVDSTGDITGRPGTYVGSGTVALSVNDLPRTTWVPGYNIGIGYKFENGVAVTGQYRHFFDAKYAAGASLAPYGFLSPGNLSDTFLVSNVFNFTPEYGGPLVDTTFPPGSTYGIWNAADWMTIRLTQRYDDADITFRVPMFETEYARTYGLAGGRWAHIRERFEWRTADLALNGGGGADFQAIYSNIVSNNMYGPFIGCGYECYLGSAFAVSAEGTAAALMDFVKQRAKYERADRATQSKHARQEYNFVPNLNGQANLWWYPIEGIQIRIGYSIMTYFNTSAMRSPVGFNFTRIDPPYTNEFIRLYHGLNVGIAFIF